MNLVFMGGEVPSHRLLLIDSGVQHISVSYWGLAKRGLPKTKNYLLSEKYPSDVKVYLDGGGRHADAAGLSTRELQDYAAAFEDFIANNYDHIAGVIEFDSQVLGSEWISDQRKTLGFELQDKYWPVWKPEMGHAALFSLSEQWENVALLGETIDSDTTLSGRTRALQSQFGTKFHGLGCAKPDNLRQVPLETASTLSWLSPMMRGETIVWDTTRLVRYQKKQKDQARPRYKNVIQKAGLDFDKILNDDSNEVTRLAIWSYLELEKSLDKKKPPHLTVVDSDKKLSDNSVHIDDPGSAETMGIDPDNRGVEVRKDSALERPAVVSRDASETRTLPVFSVNTKTVLDRDSDGRDLIRDVPIIETTHTSLRQCDTCFVAANCPAFKPQNTCAFSLPVEVKTKDQLKGLLNAIIEMQGARVAFARFAEELNGGYPDPNTGQEIDRLFKIVKSLKELEENKEFVKLTVERQTSGGVLSALFGDKANTLRELPNGGISEEDTTRIISEHIE
jgi:hypothetical protein